MSCLKRFIINVINRHPFRIFVIIMQLLEFGEDVLEVKDKFLALLNLLLLHTFELLDPKSVVNRLKRFLSLFNAYCVLQGAPYLFDVSLAAAVVNAEIHNDLLVRVEKLLVKLG